MKFVVIFYVAVTRVEREHLDPGYKTAERSIPNEFESKACDINDCGCKLWAGKINEFLTNHNGFVLITKHTKSPKFVTKT